MVKISRKSGAFDLRTRYTSTPEDEERGRLKNAGIMLIQDGKAREAAQLLEVCLKASPHDGQARSYLGLALAMSQRGKRGLQLCREAARSHPFDAEIQQNLGRVYLLAGRRRMAWETFIVASRLDEQNDQIRRVLQRMGRRRPPVIPTLPRSHPVNVYAGRLLKKIGLR